jgi:hypothetical protein
MSIENFVRRGRSAQAAVDEIIAAAKLTRRQVEILRAMRDAPEGSDESELVYDGGRTAWRGLEHVAPRTLFAFLRMCAISADGLGHGEGGVERYHINETGRTILARHERGKDAR